MQSTKNFQFSSSRSRIEAWVMLWLVFVVGMCSAGVETAISRFFTPTLGSSLQVWASLVVVVMLSMCIGYYLGGYLVNRYGSMKRMYFTILVVGIYLAILPFWAPYYVGVFVPLMTVDSLNIFFISAVLGFTLVGGPFMMFSAVIPNVIEFTSPDAAKLGGVSGRIAAIGVMGGIVGKFISVFWALPFHGTSWSIVFLGMILFISAAIGLLIEQLSRVEKRKHV